MDIEYVCMCVCIYIYIYIACLCRFMHLNLSISDVSWCVSYHIHIKHACMHTNIYMYAHTRMCIWTSYDIHLECLYAHAYMDIDMHTCKSMHVCVLYIQHAHMHKYTFIYFSTSQNIYYCIITLQTCIVIHI